MLLQTELVDEVRLLDARVDVSLGDWVTMALGQHIIPVSRAWNTPLPLVQMPERSWSNDVFTPGRSFGATTEGRLPGHLKRDRRRHPPRGHALLLRPLRSHRARRPDLAGDGRQQPQRPQGTLACDSDADCPDGFACISRGSGICLQRCTTTQECEDQRGSDWQCREESLEEGGGNELVCIGD